MRNWFDSSSATTKASDPTAAPAEPPQIPLYTTGAEMEVLGAPLAHAVNAERPIINAAILTRTAGRTYRLHAREQLLSGLAALQGSGFGALKGRSNRGRASRNNLRRLIKALALQPQRILNEVGAGFQLELFLQMRAMRFDGLDAEMEFLRNLPR